MVLDLTFDVRYDNELAHQYYGDGEKLTKQMEKIYQGKGLKFPEQFDSTHTYPPINFMQVEAEDGTDVNDLRGVEVPAGLNVEIMDFDE